jgi:uncharacterized protein (TIGR03118 family)
MGNSSKVKVRFTLSLSFFRGHVMKSNGLRGLRKLISQSSFSRRVLSHPLVLESLEDRFVLSANVLQTNLVSDLPGVAQFQDSNLVNPWGISESPGSKGSPFWISDNNAGLSTLYNTAGLPQSLVVSIPMPGDPTGAGGTPTGTVFDIGPAGSFLVFGVNTSGQQVSAKSIFLFATEDGTIVGWSPGVNPVGFDPTKPGTYGIIAVDNSGNNFTNTDPLQQTGAVYKGLTIVSGTVSTANPNGLIFPDDPNSGTVLYAANFRAGTIEVFDKSFAGVKLPAGAFADPDLPKGYAPFNVQELGGKIYVTYAKQDAAKHDDVAGNHNGFVDVFNLDGSPGLAGGKVRLVSRGALNSPWGLAIAPPSFGNLAGALLVGNFGDGRINAYNATTGASMGQLLDPDGEPIQIDGLWALKVGNGGNGGDANTVYFTAGLFGETHGLFGSLAPVAAGTDEGPAEEQMVHAAQVVFQTTVNTAIQDILNGASRDTLAQDRQALDAIFATLKRGEQRLITDEFHDGNRAAAKAHLVELTRDEVVFVLIEELLERLDHRH